MRSLRLIVAESLLVIVALGLVVVAVGCGVGGNPEVQISPTGLTPKQQEISKQMADFEASQKGARPAPR
jgi:hypothetical protein